MADCVAFVKLRRGNSHGLKPRENLMRAGKLHCVLVEIQGLMKSLLRSQMVFAE